MTDSEADAIVHRAPNPPLDTAQLERGSYIFAGTIEAIYGVKRHQANYRLKQLHLKSWVEQVTPLLLRCEGDNLYIMTHREAEEYTFTQARQGHQRMVRQVRNRTNVDYTELPQAQRKSAEHRDQFLSLIVQHSAKQLSKADTYTRLIHGGVDPEKSTK